MAEPVHSPSWYRVADLRPRLRGHARLHRHRYRGEVWYVLEDYSSERYWRFTPSAYLAIGSMDGTRTVAEIWELVCDQLGEDAPTQEELIQLLAQLHAADALQSDVAPDTRELLERTNRQKRTKLVGQLMNPLFWRIPLFDPERFLRRTIALVRPLFTVWGALLWLAVVGTGAALVVMHWTDLTESFLDRALAPQNLVLVWLIFPVVKALHELGHGYATKAFGGEVHDMGIMLLVFMPLPYVDASSASAFRKKRHRVVVGAAGMIVELFIASLAMILWLNTEPGSVRTVAYNTVFIGGISSLFFNGNPLLRFDGYYIFSDLVEIPNLRQRSTRFLHWLFGRYALGDRDAPAPHATRGERAWFAVFGTASFVYRIAVVVGILFFIATRFFFVGVVLALWSLVGWIVIPLVKGVRAALENPRIRRRRGRLVAVVGGAALILTLFAVLVPAPLNTRAEGIVWIPERALVRAGANGTVVSVARESGTWVEEGEVLFVCEDPELENRQRSLEGRRAELEARYDATWREKPGEAQMLREEITHVEESLERVREDLDALVIRSRCRGTFVAPDAADYVGRFLLRGTALAHVVDLDTLSALVVVQQDDVDFVRGRTRSVEVRLAEQLGTTLPATVRREVPTASERLPSSALGMAGGGALAVDPSDQSGLVALERVFQFDLDLPSGLGVANIGGRVYVRFRHGWEPLAYRGYRKVRRLFLARFDL